uniref:Uncharacterized protein n=1 Tax=Entomoneis paludosa TaxID=265537 RepID=A0A7S2Y819_9STRA
MLLNLFQSNHKNANKSKTEDRRTPQSSLKEEESEDVTLPLEDSTSLSSNPSSSHSRTSSAQQEDDNDNASLELELESKAAADRPPVTLVTTTPSTPPTRHVHFAAEPLVHAVDSFLNWEEHDSDDTPTHDQLWYTSDELDQIKHDLVHVEARALVSEASAWWSVLAVFHQEATQGAVSARMGASTRQNLTEPRKQLAQLYADNHDNNDFTILGLERYLLNWLFQEDTGPNRTRATQLVQRAGLSEATQKMAAFQLQQASRPWTWWAREVAKAQATALVEDELW